MPPVPALSGNATAARVSRRFQAGRPSADVAAAGVLVHVFDNFDVRPWNDVSMERRHDPSMLSCTMVNARRPELAYNYGCSGYVIRPKAAKLRCSYRMDAGSLRFACSPNSGYKMARHTLRRAVGASPRASAAVSMARLSGDTTSSVHWQSAGAFAESCCA